MILYIFITHQNNINNCYNRIKNMMDKIDNNFIIVQGGTSKDEYCEKTKILSLNCNDKYLGLSEKVAKTFNFILNNDIFNNYTHFVKLDDDMQVIKKLDTIEHDYIGRRIGTRINRKHHFKRNTGTFWDKTEYLADFKPWALGGFGYIVSRKALKKIMPNHDYLFYLYEDVYIGVLLHKVGIEPVKLELKNYFFSPEHG
jgi:hypothetical protein